MPGPLVFLDTAGIWATAVIGIVVGMGREADALLATVIVLIIPALLYRWASHRAAY